MSEPYHIKYRPSEISEVVGHAAMRKSLQGALQKRGNKSFLFTGPAGTGKTTLARCIAAELEISRNNILEIDAASNSGVEAVRELVASSRYTPIGGGKRIIIVDEAHAITKTAWQTLLKIVEEPPEYLYWVFCTTEKAKIPKTIESRCVAFELKPLSEDELFTICLPPQEDDGLEEWQVDIAVEHAGGSARQALVNLSAISEAEDEREAVQILNQTATDDDGVIKLCRALAKGCNWQQAMKIVRTIEGDREGVRRIIIGYFTKVAAGAKKGFPGASLAVLDAFGTPYPPTPNDHCLLLSLGELLDG